MVDASQKMGIACIVKWLVITQPTKVRLPLNSQNQRTHDLSWLYGYFTNIKESMILRERKKERTGKRIGA